jgi:hypothetical protein
MLDVRLGFLGACSVLFSCVAGCTAAPDGARTSSAAATSDDAGSGSVPGVVDDVWSSVSYLPWDYAPDGCFARSYYVAMEFVSRGVVANQMVINLRWMDTPTSRPQFSPVDARQPGRPPVTYGGSVVHWDYHIAALLQPPVVSEPMIFDEAMEPGLVPVATWVADANAAGIAMSEVGVNHTVTPGFNEFSTYPSTYVGISPSLAENWDSVATSSLSGTPAFQAYEVQTACDTVWTIYDCMGAAPDDPRRAALLTRTNQLVTELSQQGLMSGWNGAPLSCAPTSSFQCAAR